jgi:hypothetical protein
MFTYSVCWWMIYGNFKADSSNSTLIVHWTKMGITIISVLCVNAVCLLTLVEAVGLMLILCVLTWMAGKWKKFNQELVFAVVSESIVNRLAIEENTYSTTRKCSINLKENDDILFNFNFNNLSIYKKYRLF